jgi:hypothetical protein
MGKGYLMGPIMEYSWVVAMIFIFNWEKTAWRKLLGFTLFETYLTTTV